MLSLTRSFTLHKREPQRPLTLTLSLFPFQIPLSLIVVFGAAQPKPDIQIPLSLSDLNAYRPSHGFKVHPQGAEGLVERPTNFMQHWYPLFSGYGASLYQFLFFPFPIPNLLQLFSPFQN